MMLPKPVWRMSMNAMIHFSINFEIIFFSSRTQLVKSKQLLSQFEAIFNFLFHFQCHKRLPFFGANNIHIVLNFLLRCLLVSYIFKLRNVIQIQGDLSSIPYSFGRMALHSISVKNSSRKQYLAAKSEENFKHKYVESHALFETNAKSTTPRVFQEPKKQHHACTFAHAFYESL